MKSSVTIACVPEIKTGPWIFWDDLEASIAQAAACGFDAVELFLASGQAIQATELQQMLDHHGLTLSAIGTGAGKVIRNLTLSDPDPDIRKRAIDYCADIIALGGHFQAPVIIGSMQGNAQGNREESLNVLAESLAILAAKSAAFGTYLIYEPLNRYETNLMNTLEQGVAFIEKHKLKHVKLLADLFHMNIEEIDIAKSLIDHAAHLGHIHLADSNRRPMGNGHTDMEAISNALKHIHYPYYISAEAFPWPNPLAAAQKTMETYQNYFRK